LVSSSESSDRPIGINPNSSTFDNVQSLFLILLLNMTDPPTAKKAKTTTLRALGFCGADDSVNPNLLGIYSHLYPFVEFGVLFRPDKEGEPRYASPEWVQRLAQVAAKSEGKMKLAAHFCGARVNEVLQGNDSFLKTLPSLGFQRVQINATAVNGVDVSRLSESVESVLSIMSKHPELEFIIQKNEETKPLWEGLLNLDSESAGKVGYLPKNVSMLLDESKGTGVLASSWPNPPEEYEIGYAGGIGPQNITKVLEDVMGAGNGRGIWIDMESRLRSTTNEKDIFDLNKCYEVITAVCSANIYAHPSFIP
jgi:phosphoribosylanthranilate isomerase